jgi:hypothetical protein
MGCTATACRRRSHAREAGPAGRAAEREPSDRVSLPHQQDRYGWDGVVRLGRPGVTSAWITAASLGWAGDERGQDADPPVHAVRARDVLQLDGLRALLGALRSCRNERGTCMRTKLH